MLANIGIDFVVFANASILRGHWLFSVDWQPCHGDLVVPAHVTDFGERAFAVAAPKEWNKLPTSVRVSPSVSSFKARLKTYLFSA